MLASSLALFVAQASDAQIEPAPGEAEWDDSYYPFAREGFYVAALGFYAMENFDTDAPIENPNGPLDISGDDAGGLDLKAGYRFHNHFSAEAVFQYYSEFGIKERNTNTNDNFDGWSLSMNAKAYGLLGAIQPYAVVGLGGLVFTEKKGEDEGFFARMGGGVDLYLTDNLVVELEISYVLPAGDLDDFQFATFGGGLLYRF